jgi:hypothetical protein
VTRSVTTNIENSKGELLPKDAHEKWPMGRPKEEIAVQRKAADDWRPQA